MTLISQDANDLGGKGFVQQALDGVAVRMVIFSDGAPFDVLARASSNLLNIAQEWFVRIRLDCSTQILPWESGPPY